MKHELKIWPQYYQAVKDGSKTFEVRKNDRGFQKDDLIVLREFNPNESTRPSKLSKIITLGKYTDSEPLAFEIGYVLPIDAERVVFSLIKSEAIL